MVWEVIVVPSGKDTEDTDTEGGSLGNVLAPWKDSVELWQGSLHRFQYL